MKSLEKDRTRRYETASAMATDVERYLHDEPVHACPPSAAYRFRKFARRNKWTLIGTALLAAMFLVIMGVVAGSVGWVARDRATRQGVLEQQVIQSLDAAQTWYQSGKLIVAMSAVKRAEGLLASGGGSVELKHRIDQWRADLETVEELAQIRLELAGLLKPNCFNSTETLLIGSTEMYFGSTELI